MYVFYFYNKRPPYGHYYVVAEDMVEVMQTYPYISRLVYSHRKALDQVGDPSETPVPKTYGGGYYRPLHEYEEDSFLLHNGSDKSKTNQQTRPLQDVYRRRKFGRYPARSGEEDTE